MAPHEFFFALEFFTQGVPSALVEDLAASVFRHVGCAQDHVAGLGGALEQAVEPATAGGARRCDVQFRAHDGKLDVLVSSNGGRVWQTTIVIP